MLSVAWKGVVQDPASSKAKSNKLVSTKQMILTSACRGTARTFAATKIPDRKDLAPGWQLVLVSQMEWTGFT